MLRFYIFQTEGRVFTSITHSHNYTEPEIIKQNPELLAGGSWRPTGCTARHKVAVIVPYRDRREHLRILLSHLHPILQRQQLDYTIFVVEQVFLYHFIECISRENNKQKMESDKSIPQNV